MVITVLRYSQIVCFVSTEPDSQVEIATWEHPIKWGLCYTLEGAR